MLAVRPARLKVCLGGIHGQTNSERFLGQALEARRQDVAIDRRRRMAVCGNLSWVDDQERRANRRAR